MNTNIKDKKHQSTKESSKMSHVKRTAKNSEATLRGKRSNPLFNNGELLKDERKKAV